MPHPSSAMKTMAERYPRPDWVRRINAMGDSVGGARHLVPLDANRLRRDAVELLGMPESGFEDPGDPGFGDRFFQLVDELDRSAMHTVGRLMTRQEIARSLLSRGRLLRELAQDPAIEKQAVRAPLVVTGPARSGTTILFELLSLDPELRAPLAFEGLHPVPLSTGPVDAKSATDPRLSFSECEQEFWADVAPEFAAIHELRSDLPVECVTLTAPSFAGSHWPMVATLLEWLPEMPVSYRYHKQLLQWLQHGEPERTWLLKTPAHLMTLGLLFETYPDCWVIQTHRDPLKTMPSTVSTTAMARWMRTDELDLGLMVKVIDAVFSAALLGVIEERRGGRLPARFVDVHFQQLMQDPVETLRCAYADMGRELGDDHAERIREYVAAKPRGKFGIHRYTPEEWGFAPAELRERLRPYTDHYGIALEG